MIRTSALSEGDWVTPELRGAYPGEYFKIKSSYLTPPGELYVSPITLTTEMLKLNEWIYSPEYKEWSFGKIIIIEDEDDLIMYDGSLGELNIIRQVRVHQLQKALRMNGYKKAANNFKIK